MFLSCLENHSAQTLTSSSNILQCQHRNISLKVSYAHNMHSFDKRWPDFNMNLFPIPPKDLLLTILNNYVYSPILKLKTISNSYELITEHMPHDNSIREPEICENKAQSTLDDRNFAHYTYIGGTYYTYFMGLRAN